MLSVRTKFATPVRRDAKFKNTWQEASAYQTRNQTQFTFSSRTEWSFSRNMTSSTIKGWFNESISFRFAPNFGNVAGVWRADRRSFDMIVGEGFKSRGTHDSIVRHVDGEPGVFIAYGITSQASGEFVRGVPGWMYATNFPKLYVDVAETVGDEMMSTELFENSFAAKEGEVAGIGDMPAEDIRMGRAMLKVPGTPVGAFIGPLRVNEQWVPRNWTIQVHGVHSAEIEKREITARKNGKLSEDQRFIRIEEANEIAMSIKAEFSHYEIKPDSPVCFIGSVKASASFSRSINFAMESYHNHLRQHDVINSKVFISFAGATSALYTSQDAINIVESNKAPAPVVSSKVVSIEEVSEAEALSVESKNAKFQELPTVSKKGFFANSVNQQKRKEVATVEKYQRKTI